MYPITIIFRKNFYDTIHEGAFVNKDDIVYVFISKLIIKRI